MAAYELARAGRKVLLLEKSDWPRYKTCGGGLTQRTLKLIPFDLSSVIEQKSNLFELHFMKSNLHFSVNDRDPVVCMTMRNRFDALLVSEAVTKGANFLETCPVTEISKSADFIEVETSRGKFKTRTVIGADGSNGIVARRSGWAQVNDQRLLAPAVEYEIKVVASVSERFKETSRIDFETVPHGYAWVFGKKVHLSIGVGCFEKSSINLHECVQAYLQELGISSDDILSVEKHGFLIPIRPRSRELARDRVFLTGDAAGLADPVTAEGIYFAILSGKKAAEALLKSEHSCAAVKNYNHWIQSELLPELLAGQAIGQLLYRHPRMVQWLCRFQGQKLTQSMLSMTQGHKTYLDAYQKRAGAFRVLEGMRRISRHFTLQ
jgi:geranylgeranyl reductase family protein